MIVGTIIDNLGAQYYWGDIIDKWGNIINSTLIHWGQGFIGGDY